jgi:hypothetical protein
MRGGMGIRAKNNQLEGVGSLRRGLHSMKARAEVTAAPDDDLTLGLRTAIRERLQSGRAVVRAPVLTSAMPSLLCKAYVLCINEDPAHSPYEDGVCPHHASQSSWIFTAPAAFVHAEHIQDLINKFDLVLHSISPLREYDQGHIVGSMVEYRSVYKIRVMPLFPSINRISCKFAGYHNNCARLLISNCWADPTR